MPFDGGELKPYIKGLDKIDQVIDLLSTEDRWCKQQLRDGARRCLLGAMMAADATIALKEPILLAIEQVTGEKHSSRVEVFNDHPLTTHALVLRVLHQARDNVVNDVINAPTRRPEPAPEARVSWIGLFRSLTRTNRSKTKISA